MSESEREREHLSNEVGGGGLLPLPLNVGVKGQPVLPRLLRPLLSTRRVSPSLCQSCRSGQRRQFESFIASLLSTRRVRPSHCQSWRQGRADADGEGEFDHTDI